MLFRSCVGASGAISGMAGMYFVFFPKIKMDLVVYIGWARLKTFETTSHGAILAWLGEQTVLGFVSSLSSFNLGTAFWAHVGGLLTGIGVGYLYKSLGFIQEYEKKYPKEKVQSDPFIVWKKTYNDEELFELKETLDKEGIHYVEKMKEENS